MKKYSAAEAAAELNIDGKTLRRLVRNSATFNNAGSGARYEFTTADMPALRKLVQAHTDKPKGSRSRGTTLIEDAPGLMVSVARNDPAAVRKLTEARVDRLETALKAAGLHISQMKDREGWEPRAKQSA